MKKIYVWIISIIFAISVIFLILALSFNSQKTTDLNEAKAMHESTKKNISNMEAQSQQGSVLIDKIKSDPNQLVKEAKATTTKVIKVMKDNDKKSDSDKSDVYKNELKNIVNSELLESPELTSISLPKDYDIEVATYRGESIPVLVGNKDHYIIMNYDTFSESITNIQEYTKN